MWAYAADHLGLAAADNEYRALPVTVTISNSTAVRVDSLAGDIHIIGANINNSFIGVGSRLQTG